jgi:DNA repair exonuclease SbcCD nuclease subunit
MKFVIFSDTHFRNIDSFNIFLKKILDKNDNKTRDMRAILAGDIFDSPINEKGKLNLIVSQSISKLAFHFKEVFFVMGNHEFYKNKKSDEFIPFQESEMLFKRLFRNYYNVRLINKNNFILIEEDNEKVEIIGCTLWSKLSEESFKDSSSSRNVTESYEKLNELNREQIEFIKNNKTKPFFKNREICPKSIVITHFPPVIDCVPEDIIHKNRYGNELSEDIFDDVDYWISGHVHVNYNKKIKNCNIIINSYEGNDSFKYEYIEI